MKAPVIWLKDFTDIDVSVKELADQMTLTGSKVEEIIDYKLSGVYAAKIVSIEPIGSTRPESAPSAKAFALLFPSALRGIEIMAPSGKF